MLFTTCSISLGLPYILMHWLAFPILLHLVIWNDSEMLEDNTHTHTHAPQFSFICKEVAQSQWPFGPGAFPTTIFCLASVLGLGIARMGNLNLYWFLSSFNLLWSCNDLENAMDRSSRLSILPPVKGPLTWTKCSGREWYKGVREKHRNSGETLKYL